MAGGKMFIIAVDGSEQSIRGLHLTAALMKAGVDQAKVITVSVGITDKVAPGVTPSLYDAGKLSPEGLLMACKSELVTFGMPSKSIITQMIDPGERTIAEAIVKETDVLRRGAGLLVLGSTGKGMAKRSNANDGTTLGKVAQHILLGAKCPVVLVKGQPVHSDGPLKSQRPSMTIAVCLDGSKISQGAFDAAMHFARAGDKLHLVHVQTGDAVEERTIERYWHEEAKKIGETQEKKGEDPIEVHVACLPVRRKTPDVTEILLDYCSGAGAGVIVVGSVELVKLTSHVASEEVQMPLGSVARAISQRSQAHCVIVKNFSAI